MFYSEKGIALFLTVVILGTTLGIVLGISSLVMRQVMTVSGLGESVIALHAADSGIELLIYQIRQDAYVPECSGGSPPCQIKDITLDEFAEENLSYQLYLQSIEPPNLIIRSLGQYRQTRRAIEVNF